MFIKRYLLGCENRYYQHHFKENKSFKHYWENKADKGILYPAFFRLRNYYLCQKALAYASGETIGDEF